MASTEVERRFKDPKSILLGFLIGSLLALLVWFAIAQTLNRSTNPESQYSFQSVEDSSITSELEVIEDFARSFSGFASLYRAISTKNKNELSKLLDESVQIETLEDRHAIQSAIFERFAELDPVEAIQLALEIPIPDRSEAIESVFSVWSISDLESAVEYGLNLDRSSRHTALKAILKTRNELTEERQLEIASQFDGVRFVAQLRNERIVRELGGNPEYAWNSILNDGKPLIGKAGLLAALALDWSRADRNGVVEKIVESVKPGVDVWSSEKYVFLRYVVKILAKSNPQEIFEQTAELANPSKEALLHAVAEEWARSSPDIAFAEVSNYEQNIGYRDLTSTVANIWAKSDTQALITFMDSQSVELKLLGLEQAVLVLSQSSPQDAIELMDEMASEGLKISMIESSFAKEWSKQDPRSATEWVRSRLESFGPTAMDMLQIALVNLAPLDPELAMNIAQQNPSTSGRRGLDVEVVLSLSRTDIEAAEALLSKISIQSRLIAILDIANRLVLNADPQRALQLASHVPNDQRTGIYSSVLTKWAQNNPIQLMEELGELPTPAAQTIAANQLMSMHVGNPLLSADQLEYVDSFLNGD